MRQAIEAGVKCIDHGQLLDEPTVKLMADKGVWWSLQPFVDDRPPPYPDGSPNRQKQLEMFGGTDNAYALARKFKVRTAWGTDTLFDAAVAATHGAQLAKMVRWYAPAEVLRMATADNAELLALSGARSPYPGKLRIAGPTVMSERRMTPSPSSASSYMLSALLRVTSPLTATVRTPLGPRNGHSAWPAMSVSVR